MRRPDENRPSRGLSAWRELGAALGEAQVLSSIGAALAFVLVLELMPGINHGATATGVTTAVLLVGVSTAAASVFRRRRSMAAPGGALPRVGAAAVATTIATSCGCCAAFGGAVLSCKLAWLVHPLAGAAGILAAAVLAATLGAVLGLLARDRRQLNAMFVIALAVLLVPVCLYSAGLVGVATQEVLRTIPTVAVADVIGGALTGALPVDRAVTDLGIIAAAAGILLALLVYAAREPAHGRLL